MVLFGVNLGGLVELGGSSSGSNNDFKLIKIKVRIKILKIKGFRGGFLVFWGFMRFSEVYICLYVFRSLECGF